MTGEVPQGATAVPPPKGPRFLKLDNENSYFSGTLINLTKLPKSLASNILKQLNESQISPRLGSTGFGPEDVARVNHKGSAYHPGHSTSQTSESTQKQANLSHIAGSTPQGKPVSSPTAYSLTPE